MRFPELEDDNKEAKKLRLEGLPEGWEDVKEVFYYQGLLYVPKVICSELINRYHNDPLLLANAGLRQGLWRLLGIENSRAQALQWSSGIAGAIPVGEGPIPGGGDGSSKRSQINAFFVPVMVVQEQWTPILIPHWWSHGSSEQRANRMQFSLTLKTSISALSQGNCNCSDLNAVTVVVELQSGSSVTMSWKESLSFRQSIRHADRSCWIIGFMWTFYTATIDCTLVGVCVLEKRWTSTTNTTSNQIQP